MIVSGMALAFVLSLRFGPNTPLFQAFRLYLVERLAARLAAMERHDLILLFIVPAIVMAGGELILFFGPEVLMWYAANLAFYLDALVISAVLAAVGTARSTSRQARAGFYRLQRRCSFAFRGVSREPRTRTVAALRAKNDDDDVRSSLKLAA